MGKEGEKIPIPKRGGEASGSRTGSKEGARRSKKKKENAPSLSWGVKRGDGWGEEKNFIFRIP